MIAGIIQKPHPFEDGAFYCLIGFSKVCLWFPFRLEAGIELEVGGAVPLGMINGTYFIERSDPEHVPTVVPEDILHSFICGVVLVCIAGPFHSKRPVVSVAGEDV